MLQGIPWGKNDSNRFKGIPRRLLRFPRGSNEVPRGYKGSRVVPRVAKEVPYRIHRRGNENIVYKI